MKSQDRAHNRAFGQTLRELRKKQGLSQDVLAARARLDRTFISLLELGQRSPTLDTMVAVVTALDMSLADFFGAFCNNLSTTRACPTESGPANSD